MTDLLDALAKPPPAPSELDELMSRNPLDMTKDDINSIIAYQRADRARRAEGGTGKGRKRTDLKDHGGGAIDLAALGLIKKPVTAPKPTLKPATGAPGLLRRL
jgi:hypothetical protein